MKKIPYQIRRYLLVLGISLGVPIGYVIGLTPHNQILFFIALMFLVGLFVYMHNLYYELLKEWDIIERRNKNE